MGKSDVPVILFLYYMLRYIDKGTTLPTLLSEEPQHNILSIHNVYIYDIAIHISRLIAKTRNFNFVHLNLTGYSHVEVRFPACSST